MYFSINQIIKVDIVIERNKNPIKDCRGIIKKNICNCGISLDNIPPPILISKLIIINEDAIFILSTHTSLTILTIVCV